MARTSSNQPKASQKAAPRKGSASSPARKRAAQLGAASPAGPEKPASGFFDERMKRDIWAVVFTVLAIVVLIAAIIQSSALVTSFLSNFLHALFGLGAYILPLVFLIIAASFLMPFERTSMSARFTIGLTVIFVAILVLLALFTPDTSALFDPAQLTVRGGYLGAGIAWAGLALFGQAVSGVIMAGVMIAGLVIIGLSLSKPIERLVERLRRAKAGKSEEDSLAFQPRIIRHGAIEAPMPPSSTHPMTQQERRARNEALARRGVYGAEAMDAPDDADAPFDKAMTRKLGKRGTGLKADPGAKTSVLEKPGEADARPAAPHPQEGFVLPSMGLLQVSAGKAVGAASADELKATSACLQETLEDFGIFAKVVGWVAGPTVTLFKVDLPSGVRVSRVTALENDIALALAAPGVRIFAPIPNTNFVGIEVPNKKRKSVLLGDVLRQAPPGPLQIAIGMDVEGKAIISDLAKMPHLLIGGTTGSGKSVSINAMVMSILMRATPAEVRFVMIDPKRVEFTPYNGIPHLYVPVVTEPREAASALSWGVAEMERRLKVFSAAGARNIGQYNTKAQAGELEDAEADEIPYIVIVIDELADLMMNVGKEVEFSISRIAQLARAAGIHLIVATQRPSTNVVTGLIKANITNRIAFNVASGIDSRVVLDTPGAEKLIGLGDLLFSKPEYAKPQRIQGCYVSEEEINAVVAELKSQGEPEYHNEILKTNLITLGSMGLEDGAGSNGGDDPLIWEAAEIVVSSALGSTSNIQRRLKVGYSRAGRIMDMLEEKGVVGPPNGSKPREVLVDEMELETLKAFEQRDQGRAPSFAEE